jgi:predicted ABC-class ATPase
VDAGGPEILARSGCRLGPQGLELRFRVGLPAAGRSVLGREAAEILCRRLPRAANAVRWERLDQAAAREWADLTEDHAALQAELARRRLVAFVRDGSILPRATGASPRPLSGAVRFASPPDLRVRLPTQHHEEIEGMGIPEGVTLITGGGFHGKTTLLEAIERGVYPHQPGDGREWVVSRFGACRVRSEDGRAVTDVDLRPFIRDLPGGASTAHFATQDASGSTSLAAAIIEAIAVGADVLLLDEDTCSTNLLVRDARMQALVKKETITPLVDRVRELHAGPGVSTVMVIGGSGDYLDRADTVILMEDYRPRLATEEARAVARQYPTRRHPEEDLFPLIPTPRVPLPASFEPGRGRRQTAKARGLRELVYGDETVDLSALTQLVDDSQARAVGAMLPRLRDLARPGLPLRDLLDRLFTEVDRRGLAGLDASPELAMPRPFEVAAVVNRLRGLVIERRS